MPMMVVGSLVLAAGLAAQAAAGAEPPALMTAADLAGLPQPPPDHRIAYGPERLQFGELRLPEGAGPHPVAILIHGGCWLAAYDLAYVSALADALAAGGVATWSVEYRRVGDEGGGWPGTFADVGAAADFVRRLALEHPLDMGRVVAVGHSAGGHLALWLAARAGLAAGDELRGEAPLALRGVVALAGITDLAAYAAPTGCGAAVPGLLGGPPDEHPERLLRSSPIAMLPLGVPAVLVTAEHDVIVPAEQASSFAAASAAAGDRVELREVAGAGHFELVNPAHPTFGVLRAAVLELIELRR
jgi:acetyl esterase/lipase